jgi:hypothetical protein
VRSGPGGSGGGVVLGSVCRLGVAAFSGGHRGRAAMMRLCYGIVDKDVRMGIRSVQLTTE